MSKFSKQHYNAIAKDIREEMSQAVILHDRRDRVTTTAAITNLALRLTKRFAEDNPKVEGDDVCYLRYFRPEKFLDACSPDPDLYPLSELWEDYNG